MKRRVLTILLCLLAGAVINVLVAWGLAWNSSATFIPEKIVGNSGPRPGFDNWYVSRSDALCRAFCDSRWTDEGHGSRASQSYGELPSTLLPGWMSSARPAMADTGRHVRQGHAYGLPFISLWWEKACDSAGGGRGTIVPTGLRIDAGDVILDPNSKPATLGVLSVPRVLPVRPIWPNTLWNVLTYAAILLIMVQCFASVRGRRRNKRGLCPACAYDLRGADHDVCPECGGEIRRRGDGARRRRAERRPTSRRTRGMILLAVCAFVVGGGWFAVQPKRQVDLQHAQLILDDFVHYVMVARPLLTKAKADEFFELGLTNGELKTVLDSGAIRPERLSSALSRAKQMPPLDPAAAKLEERIERARNPSFVDHLSDFFIAWRGELFAAGLWLVAALLLFVYWRLRRRAIRYRNHWCFKCSYDLRGAEHKVCPECGAAVY